MKVTQKILLNHFRLNVIAFRILIIIMMMMSNFAITEIENLQIKNMHTELHTLRTADYCWTFLMTTLSVSSQHYFLIVSTYCSITICF